MFAIEITAPVFPADSFELSDVQRAEMHEVLSEVGRRVVAYLRSLTNEMRPPIRTGGATRAAHPGHWADVTGRLAAGYEWRVDDTPTGAQLLLFNEVEYAAYLEAHDGFFVLRGVADPGGPVEIAMREAVPQVVPGWEVRNA
jgi:hypothetical protein